MIFLKVTELRSLDYARDDTHWEFFLKAKKREN